VALNLTTAFGFVNPSLYISTGAWSIGNEMVYYALTPLIIYAFNKSLALGNVLTGATIMVGIMFSFHILHSDQSLVVQWANYINPFNNLFLYCAGIALYYNARNWQPSKMAILTLFTLPLLLFLFYPAQGDQIQIVTGASRVVFCLASVALVLAFYKNAFAVPRALSAPLTHLGVLTYGVYLLHPIVYPIVLLALKKLHIQPGSYGVVAVTILATIAAAQASFKLMEEPFIRLGKKMTSRQNAAPQSGDCVARP
jgi:peptidoglycan/LPS O-acetylase OafA/YrhL